MGRGRERVDSLFPEGRNPILHPRLQPPKSLAYGMRRPRPDAPQPRRPYKFLCFYFYFLLNLFATVVPSTSTFIYFIFFSFRLRASNREPGFLEKESPPSFRPKFLIRMAGTRFTLRGVLRGQWSFLLFTLSREAIPWVQTVTYPWYCGLFLSQLVQGTQIIRAHLRCTSVALRLGLVDVVASKASAYQSSFSSLTSGRLARAPLPPVRE